MRQHSEPPPHCSDAPVRRPGNEDAWGRRGAEHPRWRSGRCTAALPRRRLNIDPCAAHRGPERFFFAQEAPVRRRGRYRWGSFLSTESHGVLRRVVTAVARTQRPDSDYPGPLPQRGDTPCAASHGAGSRERDLPLDLPLNLILARRQLEDSHRVGGFSPSSPPLAPSKSV